MRQFYANAGATNFSVRIRIANADGTPKTDVTATTPGLALSYIRQGGDRVLIGDSSSGLTNLVDLDDAHVDGGILHDVGGNYRFDIPDLAVAGGAGWVEIEGVVGDGVVFGCQVHVQNSLPEVNLTEIAGDQAAAVTLQANVGSLADIADIESAILQLQALLVEIDTAADALLTRTPNAAPGAPGGLPTVDAQNRIAGIQGTIGTLDELDTAQDAQHASTRTRLPPSLSAGGHMRADLQTVKEGGIGPAPPYSPA